MLVLRCVTLIGETAHHLLLLAGALQKDRCTNVLALQTSPLGRSCVSTLREPISLS